MSFGGELRRLRASRGLTFRELGRLAGYTAGYLSQIEHGQRPPNDRMAAILDRALQSGGSLSAMLRPALPQLADPERVRHAAVRPSRADAATVEALRATLREYRRLDDLIPASVLIPSIRPLQQCVAEMARDARGPVADDVLAVAALWTQAYGWVLAEAREDVEAARVLTVAEEMADAVSDGVLSAQVENFRGYLARHQARPRGVVRHFLAAYYTPGASALQRIGDAVQAAHGYAMLGDRTEATRLLREADELRETSDGAEPPEAAYWLTPEFHHLSLGQVHLELGDHGVAAEHLRAGLASLPSGHAGSEWAAEYREDLVRAENEGDQAS